MVTLGAYHTRLFGPGGWDTLPLGVAISAAHDAADVEEAMSGGPQSAVLSAAVEEDEGEQAAKAAGSAQSKVVLPRNVKDGAGPNRLGWEDSLSHLEGPHYNVETSGKVHLEEGASETGGVSRDGDTHMG